MVSGKTFRTKTGFCHILPDKIVLTRDGAIGNISETVVGNDIARILVIYGLISIGLLYFAFDSYWKGLIIQPILFGIFILYFIYGIVTSLNNSAATVIHRKSIKQVKLKMGIAGFTRSRFEILFEDHNGKLKKRLIMLPGSLANGQNEAEKAVNIMREEKLLEA